MSAKWQWDSATMTWLCFSLQSQVHPIAPWDNVKRQRYVNWYLCHGGLALCFSLQHTCCSTLLLPHMTGPYNHKVSSKLEKENIFQVATDQTCPVLSNASSRAQMPRGGWSGCSSPVDLLSPLILCHGPGKALLCPAAAATLDVPLCEPSVVEIPWPSHGLLLSAAAEAAEMRALAAAIAFAGSETELSNSRVGHTGNPALLPDWPLSCVHPPQEEAHTTPPHAPMVGLVKAHSLQMTWLWKTSAVPPKPANPDLGFWLQSPSKVSLIITTSQNTLHELQTCSNA